ncbi:peroxidase family protein [Populus alba x Populus x berolinensis]|nr:peroxidase family protein [Populus alba x Populus x berolinensis]
MADTVQYKLEQMVDELDDLERKGMFTRIVEIYRLAVMRFKGDLELWFRYLEFCRDKKNGKRLGNLRACPHSEDPCVEYLRMELMYLNKLKARKVALGEEKENAVHDNYDMLLDEEEEMMMDQMLVRKAFQSGGPYWFLPLGRRDGLTASESDANEQLPGFSEPLENITAKFTSKGLELKDVVVLSGAHTIGFAQCFTFKSRLFDFGGSGEPDPLLDTSLLTSLQSTCPNQDDSNTKLAPLDSASSSKFDNLYYKLLLNNSGLLQSDQALMGDNTTASLVLNYSKFPYLFFKDFGASMVKMANIGVLTGQNGEIRKQCRFVN